MSYVYVLSQDKENIYASSKKYGIYYYIKNNVNDMNNTYTLDIFNSRGELMHSIYGDDIMEYKDKKAAKEN